MTHTGAANSGRLLSLDVFRGMTLVGMVLVNNPGSWSHVYFPFEHAEWHGCTFTDLIFPFFLFIVGVSIAFALGGRLEQGINKRLVLTKILKRTVIIFLCGLFLHGFPYFDLTTIRIPGVLQRIAVVYGISSTLFLFLDWKKLVIVSVLLLISYWAAMTLIPVPDFGPSNLEPSTNLAGYIDRVVLEGHLWSQSKTWDPEGVLSTLPAVVTCLIGILTGLWLKKIKEDSLRIMDLIMAGGILVVIGLWWNLVFPINKALWTSSYVLYTGGIAILCLGLLVWLVDIRDSKKWTFVFKVYGRNSLFVFVASGLVAKSLYLIKWETEDGLISLGRWLYSTFLDSWLPSYPASLGYALLHIFIFYLVLRWMYHKNILIKI